MPIGASGIVFDFIIVGAGSAGCVLADRLTADGRNTVLVLEFGGSDRSVLIRMPAALSIPMNMAKYNWRYETEPEPHLGGRRLHCPRGKVIGGSSSINGLVYVRGNPLDFERWEEEGAAGWGYRHVLPYFRRAEARQEGGDAWRGASGPLATCYGRLANPLYRAFVEAARQAGYPATDDVNGERQEGFGRLDMTVKDGARCSAADAYLKPAMRRRNLEVRTRALATRILFEGMRAVGVRYLRDGVENEVRAGREVILCGGPINSPHLLKLSGVGPAGELRSLGIDVVHHLPGVGREPAGPPRVLLPGRLHPADHPLLVAGADRQSRDPRALAPPAGLARGDQPLRDRRVHPLASRRPPPGHPVPLPAARRDLRREGPRVRARVPGPCGADAVQEPRLRAA